MFEAEAYMEVKRIIYRLYKVGVWSSLDPRIQKVYTDDLKYWNRRLGNPNDNVESQGDNAPDTSDDKQPKKPDRKKYYGRPFSLEKAEDELGLIPADPFSIEDHIMEQETYQELHTAIDMLDDYDKGIIEMYYYEDMKEWQIGQELGVVQKTVNNHKTKSLKKLKKTLKKSIIPYSNI